MYQGSARSIGFRSRAVADPSRRMREEAEQIKQQGDERIRGMERQASQLNQETQRINDIQARHSDYELRALSKFSETINQALQQQAENYIQEEKARGMMDYMNQPPEALAEDSQQVDEAYQRSADVHTEISKFAETAPDKETEARVRRTSRYYKVGWDLAAMQEAVNGFGAHLLTELNENTTKIQDPNTGEYFILNQYDGPDQWNAAANYIKQEYLKNNNPAGLSAKVQATKFLPALNQALNTQRKQYVQQFIDQENQEMLDNEENLLTLSFKNPNNPVSAAQQLESFLKVAPRLLNNLGQPGGGFKAARALVKSLYTQVAKEDPTRAAELIEVLKNTQVPDHPAAKKGGGSLVDLYSDEFGVGELERIRTDEAYNRFKDDQAQMTMKVIERKQAIAAAFKEKTPSLADRRVIAASIDKDFGHTEAGRELEKWVLTWQPLFLDKEESETLAKAYLALNGEITEAEAAKLHPEVYEQYKENVVEKASFSSVKEQVTVKKKELTNLLYSKIDDFSTLQRDTPGLRTAESDLHKLMLKEARQSLATGEAKTEAEAVEIGFERARQKFEEDNSQDYPNNASAPKFYVAPGRQGLPYYTKDRFTKKGNNEVQARHNEYIINHKNKIQENPETVRETLIVTNPGDLELTTANRAPQFFYSMARDTGGKYSAFEILNFQREKAGKTAIPLPTEAQQIDNVWKRYPELRSQVIRNPSPRTVHRVAQQTGMVTARNVLKAIGFQESGGKYDAQNWDPRTGNDKDPALGKYQILWSNVLNWGPKFGLGKPKTMREFLNNHEYQEKLATAAMTEYIRQSLNASGGDPDLAVRMAAAFWYGGTGGFRNYDSTTYGAVGPYPSMRGYTMSVLQKYKGG